MSLSCDAPRNNPLDPMNPDGLGIIDGRVQTLSVPYRALEGVSVYFDKGAALAKTDRNGLFNIEKMPLVTGNLIFSKAGYLTDTLKILWNGLKRVSVSINLNAIPVLDSLIFYTVVINQYNTSPSYELVIKTKIIDEDNDIDSVYIINQTYGLTKGLDFNVIEKKYMATINSQELLDANIQDIEQLIGEEFQIMVKDKFGIYFHVGTSKVTRVIKSEVDNLIPAGGDTTGAYPVFRWNSFKAGYPFTYTLEVYTNDLANSQLILYGESIAPNIIQLISPVPLPQKSYYWVLWIVDNFQNRSRSKPKTFEVR